MFKSINPANQQVLKEYESDSITTIESKIANADKAYKHWKDLSYAQRGNYFTKAGNILRENKEHYAKLITLEMGKPLNEAIAEIEKCASVCNYYAENASAFLQPVEKEINGKKGKVEFQPLGVIFGIFPWNYPFWQVFRFAVPTLMAGNTGIFKHSPNVPQSAEAIEQVFIDAGFPQGVFQNTYAEVEHTENIISNLAIKAVTLTGSERAGSAVAALAGKYIKKSVLELGGSDPFIVFPDADLDHAVEVGITSRYLNCGQSCIAAKRFIVHEAILDDFTKRFTEKVNELKVGSPLEDETNVGPLARPDLLDNLKAQVDDAINKGAKLIGGNATIPTEGSFYPPAIITNITPEMKAYHEELFGPVASLYSFKTEEEAIELANATEFGLGGSVWTKDKDRAERVALKVETGSMYINELMKSMAEMPFGGINKSGFGRELSEFGIHEFVNSKTVFNY